MLINLMNGGLFEVRNVAEKMGFDVWWCVPGKYFVVCDFYLNISHMFDDRQVGYDEAIEWMHKEKDEVLANR